MSLRSLGLVALTLALASLPAQERSQDPAPAIQSGPPQGRVLTELKVVAVTGPRKGQEYDAAAEMKSGPAAILFMHDPMTRNVAPMLRGFDQDCASLLVLGLRACTVRLAADRTAAEQHTPLIIQSLKMRNPMVVSTEGAEGPGNYALNRKATLTLVLCKDGVVQESIAYTDTGANDVPAMRQKLTALTGQLAAGSELETLDRTLPKDRTALIALLTRMEQDRQRLQQLLTETERQLSEARGAGRPMDTTERPMRELAAEAAGQQLSGIVRRLGRAESAEHADNEVKALDKLLTEKPDLKERARTAIENLAREPRSSAACKEKAAAWLEKNPK